MEYRKGIVFTWVFWILSMTFVSFSFYSLGQKVDAIDVEPVVRFASNDAELEEQLKLYEDLLVGLLVCEAVK